MRKKEHPRMLKVDDNYQPPEEKDGDELYQNGIFVFNISRMFEDIESGKLSVVKEQIDVAAWFKSHFAGKVNEEHMPNVQLGMPIIQAEISPGRYNIIDGNHRMEKARREGIAFVDSYKLAGEQLPKYLSTESAYKSYIDYWNGKLEDLEAIEKLRNMHNTD